MALTVDNLDAWEEALLPSCVGGRCKHAPPGSRRGSAAPSDSRAAMAGPGVEGPIAVVDSAGDLVAVYVAGDGVARAEVVIS